MALLWLVPVIGLLGLFLYHYRKTRSYVFQTVEKLYNGPKPVPFLGNALEFPLNSEGIYSTLMRFSKEYERFYRIWLGPDVFIVCYDPKDVELILSSSTHIVKSDVYRFAIPWIGYGLLTSSGAKWKTRRRIITPTFHFKILEDFIDTFEANGAILIEKLREHAQKPAFNVYPYVNLYALDNISETAMGVPINAQKDSNSTYVRAIKTMCHVVNTRAFQPWLMPDLIFNISKYGAIQREALAVLHGHTKTTIKNRREVLKQKKLNSFKNDDDDLNQKKKLAFLDLLLESAEGSLLTNNDIQEEMDTFLFEGHDTVTSGISYTLYALSKNPEIQEKVYQEQISLFGDSKKPATCKEYNEMKYLERVLKEAQRLYPSVPIYGRLNHEDLKLSDGYVLPKGSQTIVLASALHLNPTVWPSPTVFDPDRFLPENAALRSPYAHVPFSAGARNCIGQRFAMLEMKASVSKVIRNFKLLPCAVEDEARLVSELVLLSANGINIKLEERT